MAIASLKKAGPSYRTDGFHPFETDVIIYTVKDISETSEMLAKRAAITATGFSVLDPHPDTIQAAKGMKLKVIDVNLVGPFNAEVRLTFSIPTEPFVDGDWIYEVQSVARTVNRGLDFEDEQIKIKYLPTKVDVPDRDQWIIDNELEFSRGATVNARRDLIQVLARKEISKAVNDAAPPSRKVFEWPSKYMEFVNKDKTAGIALEGQWLMNGMRVYTRNNGLSYIVEANFLYNRDGHENFVIFTNRHGLIPSDINIPTAMKKPWPVSDERVADTVPFGASRPQTLRGLKDFTLDPLNIDLGQFIVEL